MASQVCREPDRPIRRQASPALACGLTGLGNFVSYDALIGPEHGSPGPRLLLRAARGDDPRGALRSRPGLAGLDVDGAVADGSRLLLGATFSDGARQPLARLRQG